ncbi:DsbC family protein [Vulcaniibacterium tengchongense]|uniref:Thiol:disulfide interchange protein n=1 Tax=Vulcaniibacterium tengchongense TaxID=1273429 RepID=A0A3N4V9A7_9GAMM|nr:DsbC family protein [Vulcaniibacterium tengchongense]RPE79566.1 thiol:disulfide interchange protein DsbC [Vulcaniibacterium tengchongense]
MKRTLIALVGAISLSACAQAPQPADAAKTPAATTQPAAARPAANTPEARAVEAVRQLNPHVEVERVGAAPLPGFREAVVAGQVVYVSDDGRYLFLPGAGGALFDVNAKKNLSEAAMAQMRVELLKTIPASERIVFGPPNPKYTVTVFTDVECGYCRKLHSEIAEYNRQGIAIEYLAFPRMGIGSEDYKKMVSVWCAPDRKTALTDAKNDRALPNRECKTTVNAQYDLGQRVGLTGTPMILAADGTQLGGYVPPKALREALDRLAAEKAPATGAAAAPSGG